jgi:pimeloyl-ACP methyl ester carboxylesterase
LQAVINSDGVPLAAHLARPPAEVAPVTRGLVLCHGFPAGPDEAARPNPICLDLAERIASDTGWSVLTFNFRGTGASGGDFSPAGWMQDLAAAADHLAGLLEKPKLWLAGWGIGGSLCLCLADDDPRVQGVATMGAPVDFHAWAADPVALMERAKSLGLVRNPGAPHLEDWTRSLNDLAPLAAAARLAPRPLLIVHGVDDGVVPVQDARALADTAQSRDDAQVELRVLSHAGHRLGHDPRAVALLMGWMERQTGG